jgi:hypothetical protein
MEIFSGPVTIIVYLDQTETWLQRKNVLNPWDSVSDRFYSAKFTVQDLPWEVILSRLGNFSLLRNIKVHCRVYRSPQVHRVLSQFNLVHNFTVCLTFILILFSYLHLNFSSLILGISDKTLYVLLMSIMSSFLLHGFELWPISAWECPSSSWSSKAAPSSWFEELVLKFLYIAFYSVVQSAVSCNMKFFI